jgi:four helix bundle protein
MMKKENAVQFKSYAFAIRFVKLSRYLYREKKEYILSKQILRSGTSIGANIEEAIGGHSRRDFLHKISIAYKEARETRYWLKLLRDSNILQKRYAEPIIKDCDELIKLTASIIRTMKQKYAPS